MNIYTQLFYEHLRSLPYGDYIRIRDELCVFLHWNKAKFYNKLMGKTRLNYQDRVLIETFFNEKIFKIE